MRGQGLKQIVIACGVYRPARYVFDLAFRRRELAENRFTRNLLSKLVGPGDVCFDVGANIGNYAAILRSLRARVVAVEPQPQCSAELQARFGRDKNVSIEAVALGAEVADGDFFVRAHTSHSGMIQNWNSLNLRTIKVPVTTLDRLIEKYGKPRLVKIDVEGYELEVVKGLRNPIPMMSVEYHLSVDDVRSKKQLLQTLSDMSKIEVNIVTHATHQFFWPTFVSLEEFFTVFPHELGAVSLTDVPEHTVGDIYIRSYG